MLKSFENIIRVQACHAIQFRSLKRIFYILIMESYFKICKNKLILYIYHIHGSTCYWTWFFFCEMSLSFWRKTCEKRYTLSSSPICSPSNLNQCGGGFWQNIWRKYGEFATSGLGVGGGGGGATELESPRQATSREQGHQTCKRCQIL